MPLTRPRRACLLERRLRGPPACVVELFVTAGSAAHAKRPRWRLRRCAHCFLKGICEQCPAKSWAESGMLDTPVEYVCEVAHDQARDLGLLEPGECAWQVTDWKARVERI